MPQARRVLPEGSAVVQAGRVVQAQGRVRLVVLAYPVEGQALHAVVVRAAVRVVVLVEAPAVVGVPGRTSVPAARSVVAVWMSWSRSPLLRTHPPMPLCRKARSRFRAV